MLKEQTSDQKRAIYNQQIVQKENEIDQINESQKEIERSFYRLEEELQTGFYHLRSLNEDQLTDEERKYHPSQQREYDLERSFRQRIQDAQEEFTYVFRKELHQMEDEREELYKKRSELPWD